MTTLTTIAATGVLRLSWLLLAFPLFGAAVLLLGGRRTDRWASMGPRSIDRGIGILHARSSQGILASMGPRSIDRGIHRERVRATKASRASMGPRSIDRGIRSSYGTARAL